MDCLFVLSSSLINFLIDDMQVMGGCFSGAVDGHVGTPGITSSAQKK